MSQFNKLSDAEAERLFLLSEEAGELVQTIGKILRHGYESCNPFKIDDGTNREQLEREIGDLRCAVHMMAMAKDFNTDRVDYHTERAEERKPQWLHHQEKNNGLG
jgi:NTP pyrophosphatase (non-canonical NTP hydrolase)